MIFEICKLLRFSKFLHFSKGFWPIHFLAKSALDCMYIFVNTVHRPISHISEGRKSGAKWVEMVRNGSISGIQNFSNEKRPILTDIN